MNEQSDLFADLDAPRLTFRADRATALQRLERFVPRAGSAYAAKRNYDLPGHPHVSALSPYIRHRALTEAEVAREVLERFAPSTAEKFLQEICWRSYFKGWLERRPGIWRAYQQGLEAARNRLATEAGLRRAWEEACEGKTGIAPFDDWARQLVAEGYLHNHARMWFASIWMHTLRLPWELGADFFLRHLLDGDPASNTLSWRWVAGLHTRGKHYQARASNIAKYTSGRYDPWTLSHQLASDVAPMEGPEHPKPRPVPDDQGWSEAGRTGLLLHEDDLHPDYLFTRGLKPDAVAVLIAPEDRSPLSVSRQVIDFTTALAQEAGDRFGATSAPTSDLGAIHDWAQAEGLTQIVTPYAPTGPLCDKLDALEARLDIPLRRPLRAWDAAAWPHATAGFFKLKSRIPDVLETILEDLGGDDLTQPGIASQG